MPAPQRQKNKTVPAAGTFPERGGIFSIFVQQAEKRRKGAPEMTGLAVREYVTANNLSRRERT